MLSGREKIKKYLAIIGVLLALVGVAVIGHYGKSKNVKDDDKSETSSKKVTYNQWYLNDSEAFAEHTNMLAWAMDQPKGKADVDMAYEKGMDVYHKQRDVNVAIIDSKEDHGKRIFNIINDYDEDNSYVSLCEKLGIETFLIDVNYDNLKEDKVLNAIREAESKGASLCVMAFTSTLYSKKIMECMKNSKMLFVTPAGNDGVKLGNFKCYPAMYKLDNVLTVGDERCDGRISDLSNYGENYVDILAPGTDIVCIDDGKHYESGTSYACAIAAGVCAIVKAGSEKEYNNVELKNYICSLCVSDDDTKSKVKYGRIGNIGDYLLNK